MVRLQSARQKTAGLIFFLVILLLCMAGSILFGITRIPFARVIEAYSQFNGSTEHLIIRTARVPRALIAAAVGGSLAVAGTLMQALTRNPLASPSLFGINSGAALLIVIASGFFNVSGLKAFTWLAFAGAAISAIVVYALGSIGRDGMNPIKITLAGAAVTALFASLMQGILLTNGKTFEQVLFWIVGSVAGREMSMLESVFPYMLCGFVASLIIARQVNVLAMGDDVAKGLGQRTAMIKLVCAVVIVFLAGGSVAVAGPIAFIGIIIPHITRFLVGTDHRWVIPYCIVLGAILLVGADLGARFIAMPKEVPVGVMTALIGVPFFVYIARKGGFSS
ncbi:FecCD family ABC transporter permease [Paenibacillus thalictri]|uniref:Iron ABC transporter permease n=1 Tax=Paenibacillus thalictri TaxID=2527873 RepID=A0A4Q9DTD4_9BACL|nr:iron ABC transporter permease [Paenibacillus thalictri]TBL78622.1 iron ABC transporter permease [Paenibacillus thalictri]